MHVSPAAHRDGISSISVAVSFEREAIQPARTDVCFSVICQKYHKRLFRVALRIVRNDADAEDAVQESLLRAYLKIETFRGEARFYTWLVSIVINTSLMILRKRSRYPHTSLDATGDESGSWADSIPATSADAEAEVIHAQHRSMLRAAVANLPPQFRGVMQEWLKEEASMADLSRTFGISVPAAKSRVLRARERVADRLTRQVNKAPSALL